MVVARDRVAGVVLAKSMAASVILMDDGFQNPAVVKDASLIVIDSERAIGNGQVMPAGPLRAPLPAQIERTDALVVIGDGKGADAAGGAVSQAQGKPVLRARFLADDASLAALRGKRALAFAGIGDPMRFFNTLSASGIEVVRGRTFADHHAFSPRQIDALARGSQARRAGAGDDGKGSCAAARPGRRCRAVQGDARVRRCGRIAEVRQRPPVQGAGEEVSKIGRGWVLATLSARWSEVS